MNGMTTDTKAASVVPRHRRGPGGFGILLKNDAEYRDIFDKPTLPSAESSLTKLLTKAPLSQHTAMMLTPIEWKLDHIDFRNCHNLKPLLTIEQTRLKVKEQSPPEKLKIKTEPELSFPVVVNPDPKTSEPEQSIQKGSSPLDSKQQSSSSPAQGIKRSLPTKDEGEKKIVGKCCRSCYMENLDCDYRAQCGNCHKQGKRCVHILCPHPMKHYEHCNLMHRGEWDEGDPDWIVYKQRPRIDDGGLSPSVDKYRPRDPGLAWGDCYRPVDVERRSRW